LAGNVVFVQFLIAVYLMDYLLGHLFKQCLLTIICCEACIANDWCCCHCRVLEQSYMAEDTKLGTKRKHADLWFVDPLNPHERKRNGRRPVGLKNVGNTCWFSAVIQVCS